MLQDLRHVEALKSAERMSRTAEEVDSMRFERLDDQLRLTTC
jgi:hypothetical protein